MQPTPLTLATAYDALFLEHVAPEPHPERPERLNAALTGLESALGREANVKRWQLPARVATDTELSRIHSEEHIATVNHAAGGRGYLDADTFYAPASVAAAKLAAGQTLAMVEALLTKQADAGVALVRPPGHHATRDAAMGFCLLNNAAAGAAHALSLGARRVAILDWDVHHGNGTEDIFYERPEVLYISTHQFPWYPGTGKREDVGRAGGVGFNLNIPFAAAADDAVYLAAGERLIAPVLEQYAPDVLLISAGFDAHRRDPLAQMRLSSSGFAALLRAVVAPLRRSHETKIGLVLEGGYDLAALEESVAACVSALCDELRHVGSTHRVAEPELARSPIQPLSPSHEGELELAMLTQREFWKMD